MRRNDEMRCAQQWAIRSHRLLANDIQSRSGDLSRAKGVRQILLDDHGAAGDIENKNAILRFSEILGADQAACLGR